jgi:hypothetical protein
MGPLASLAVGQNPAKSGHRNKHHDDSPTRTWIRDLMVNALLILH